MTGQNPLNSEHLLFEIRQSAWTGSRNFATTCWNSVGSEFADWLLNVPSSCNGPQNSPRSRANRVKQEVFRRYGLEINLNVASRLLRKHGSWRRGQLAASKRKHAHVPIA